MLVISAPLLRPAKATSGGRRRRSASTPPRPTATSSIARPAHVVDERRRAGRVDEPSDHGPCDVMFGIPGGGGIEGSR
jgi:hypothetical protein